VAVLKVHAVKTERFDQQEMRLDHERNVMVVAHFPQGVGGAADHILIRRRQSKAHAGYVECVQQAGQGLGELREFELRRGDQINLWLLAV
jgi:hypothetical protein